MKSLSQTTRPYTSTPHSGPKHFLPTLLKIDDDRDQSAPLLPNPTSSSSSSSSSFPLNTPIHTLCKLHEPSPPMGLVTMQEFRVTHTPAAIPRVDNSDPSSSINAPQNSTADKIMGTQTPLRILNAEEEVIFAHLALAETNRTIMSRDGPNHRTILPQFTPIPVGDFPIVHMSHCAQIFDHLDRKLLLAWFQVEHPKFMVRVFDHSGKDVVERGEIIADRIRANIDIVADFVHQDVHPGLVFPPKPHGGRGSKNLPVGFLVHNVSEETKDVILKQRIWSAADITFEALPFNCSHPPELLFCLSGFTISDVETVRKTVEDVWSEDENRYSINDLFSMSEIQEETLIYKATRDLIRSIRVEILDFKVSGGVSVPRFYIFAISPSCNAKTWADLRKFLHSLDYPTGIYGCGVAVALYPCQICHSFAHPRIMCPFPNVPLWNGPEYGNRNVATSSRPTGRQTRP
ncbi:uncharacterized protein EDB93DRAFT_1250189 [Suillus bovinus]|uniref:uncharacterized protein n=1 Tax=Suillus bovinus TaxID=48563 RepID=UPI001B872DC2|nr:uncharacterized protein EDB93DRAFT_1250189 [Suillus bovinus]KAG2148755.1 hypothetical protein EDB93DRAFT_1250189 [Suillus bovinus]